MRKLSTNEWVGVVVVLVVVGVFVVFPSIAKRMQAKSPTATDSVDTSVDSTVQLPQ